MQEDELAALVAKMGAVIVRFEQRCEATDQQQSALTQQLPAMLEEKVDGLFQTLSGQASVALREGLGPPTDHLQQRLRSIAAEAEQTTRALKAAQADIASQRRLMWWGLGAVLVLSLISLVATYQSLYGFYQSRYTQLKAQVTYLDAVNRADVVPCGDGRLCAHVDPKSPRFGDKKQYRVVEPRP